MAAVVAAVVLVAVFSGKSAAVQPVAVKKEQPPTLPKAPPPPPAALSKAPPTDKTDLTPQGRPQDFFPTAPGTRWVYSIQTPGTVPPVFYSETNVPTADGKIGMYETRGMYQRNKTGGRYILDFSIKGATTETLPFKSVKTVELTVHEDRMGAFHECKRAFFSLREAPQFDAEIVLLLDRRKTGSITGMGWGQGDPWSRIPLLFEAPPFSEKTKQGSSLKFRFHGLDKSVAGFDGVDCLRFERLIERNPRASGERTGKDAEVWKRIDEGFSEQLWFARGKGLVRLVQTAQGENLMIWTLDAYTAGSE